MKAYHGKDSFSGGREEALDNSIGVYETMAKMCQVTEEEKLQSLPIMLKGDALSYFFNNMQSCSTYTEVIQMLKQKYNIDEKRIQILTAWQSMTLTKAMKESPDQS